jgi:ADP-ribose pyrophosphatase YjhB (NUDIX family)
MTDEKFSRDYPERPFVGVGAVVWRDDRFLLVKRGKAPGLGEWSLPGGAQHVGETVFEAARREIMEEAGLEIEVAGLIDVVDSIRHDSGGAVSFHFTLIDVLAEWRAGEPVAGDDAADAQWFSLDDLDGLRLWDETARVIRRSAELRNGAAWPSGSDHDSSET